MNYIDRRPRSTHLNCGLQHAVAIQTIRYSSNWSGEYASRYAEPASVHTSEHHITAIQTQLGLKTTWSYCLQRIRAGMKSKYNIQTSKRLSDVTLDFRLRSIFVPVSKHL